MLNLMIQWLNAHLATKEEGQGLVEYALIIVLISIVSIAALTALGGTVTGVFNQANSALTGTGS